MNPIEKALKHPSYPNAVAGICYDCMGGHGDDANTKKAVSARVRECHLCRCPLWTVRPWRPVEQQAQDLATAQACRQQADESRALDLIELANKTAKTAYAHPTSKRQAIQAYCWQCLGRHPKTCKIDTCTAWLVRGGKKHQI